MAAAEKCMTKIGQEHQYIMHNWAKDVLGLTDFNLFTDYLKTGEDKDEKRGVPYHYEQSPEDMHQKMLAEFNLAPDKTKIKYFLEDRYIKVQMIRQDPYKGAKPDPNATVVTEYYIAADKTQLPEEASLAMQKGDNVALLKMVADMPGNNGKFPIIVKSKRRFFNGQVRDLDKTVYSQYSTEEAFAAASTHFERWAAEFLYKNEMKQINRRTHYNNKDGMRKLAVESPDAAAKILEAELVKARSNVKLLEDAKKRLQGLSSCMVNEPGWQEAIRKRMRDDMEYARYSLLYIDVIREILKNQNAEMQGGYINGPIPEMIPWKPEGVPPDSPLHKVPNPYDMKADAQGSSE